MFSARIVTTDHYQAVPLRGLDACYSDFRGSEARRVPVARVYGATPSGQKTCMHVHGVFPYLYVPFDGTLPVDRYLRQFAGSVDKAINVAQGKASSGTQHVYKISLVSGIPFYGYHDEEQMFLKIYLYNPLHVRKVADLLLGGGIMNKSLQPYESHIPYLLQLFIDYNLYGMNMLNVMAVKFRRPTEKDGEKVSPDRGDSSRSMSPELQALEDSLMGSSCTPPDKHWDAENIPEDLWLGPEVERQSSCELEVDVVATDILNRLEVGANVGSNPGLTALWEDERQRRRERGLDSQITPPGSPDRGDVPWTDAEAALQERLQDIIQDLQPYLKVAGSPESQPVDSQIFPSTPSASLVESHVPASRATAEESLDSQDTVIIEDYEDEEDAPPIINELSILRTVSSSQSFRAERDDAVAPSQILGSTQDRALAQMLASLAEDDGSPASSQAASQAAAHLVALEEQDSILSQASGLGGEESDEGEEGSGIRKETLNMSQKVWEGEVEEGESAGSGTAGPSAADFNLEGMDQSWNSSQWVAAHDEEEEEGEEDLPQFDGPVDNKHDDKVMSKIARKKKMQGPSSMAASPRTKSDASARVSDRKAMQKGKVNGLRDSKDSPGGEKSPAGVASSARSPRRAAALKFSVVDMLRAGGQRIGGSKKVLAAPVQHHPPPVEQRKSGKKQKAPQTPESKKPKTPQTSETKKPKTPQNSEAKKPKTPTGPKVKPTVKSPPDSSKSDTVGRQFMFGKLKKYAEILEKEKRKSSSDKPEESTGKLVANSDGPKEPKTSQRVEKKTIADRKKQWSLRRKGPNEKEKPTAKEATDKSKRKESVEKAEPKAKDLAEKAKLKAKAPAEKAAKPKRRVQTEKGKLEEQVEKGPPSKLKLKREQLRQERREKRRHSSGEEHPPRKAPPAEKKLRKPVMKRATKKAAEDGPKDKPNLKSSPTTSSGGSPGKERENIFSSLASLSDDSQTDHDISVNADASMPVLEKCGDPNAEGEDPPNIADDECDEDEEEYWDEDDETDIRNPNFRIIGRRGSSDSSSSDVSLTMMVGAHRKTYGPDASPRRGCFNNTEDLSKHFDEMVGKRPDSNPSSRRPSTDSPEELEMDEPGEEPRIPAKSGGISSDEELEKFELEVEDESGSSGEEPQKEVDVPNKESEDTKATSPQEEKVAATEEPQDPKAASPLEENPEKPPSVGEKVAATEEPEDPKAASALEENLEKPPSVREKVAATEEPEDPKAASALEENLEKPPSVREKVAATEESEDPKAASPLEENPEKPPSFGEKLAATEDPVATEPQNDITMESELAEAENLATEEPEDEEEDKTQEKAEISLTEEGLPEEEEDTVTEVPETPPEALPSVDNKQDNTGASAPVITSDPKETLKELAETVRQEPEEHVPEDGAEDESRTTQEGGQQASEEKEKEDDGEKQGDGDEQQQQQQQQQQLPETAGGRASEEQQPAEAQDAHAGEQLLEEVDEDVTKAADEAEQKDGGEEEQMVSEDIVDTDSAPVVKDAPRKDPEAEDEEEGELPGGKKGKENLKDSQQGSEKDEEMEDESKQEKPEEVAEAIQDEEEKEEPEENEVSPDKEAEQMEVAEEEKAEKTQGEAAETEKDLPTEESQKAEEPEKVHVKKKEEEKTQSQKPVPETKPEKSEPAPHPLASTIIIVRPSSPRMPVLSRIDDAAHFPAPAKAPARGSRSPKVMYPVGKGPSKDTLSENWPGFETIAMGNKGKDASEKVQDHSDSDSSASRPIKAVSLADRKRKLSLKKQQLRESAEQRREAENGAPTDSDSELGGSRRLLNAKPRDRNKFAYTLNEFGDIIVKKSKDVDKMVKVQPTFGEALSVVEPGVKKILIAKPKGAPFSFKTPPGTHIVMGTRAVAPPGTKAAVPSNPKAAASSGSKAVVPSPEVQTAAPSRKITIARPFVPKKAERPPIFESVDMLQSDSGTRVITAKPSSVPKKKPPSYSNNAKENALKKLGDIAKNIDSSQSTIVTISNTGPAATPRKVHKSPAGSAHSAQPKVYASPRKEGERPRPRSEKRPKKKFTQAKPVQIQRPEGRVSLPYTVNPSYHRGQSSKKLETKTRTFSVSGEEELYVRVLKTDCFDFDLREVGNEKLVLAKCTKTDIEELKQQVKLEEKHKRTEHIMPLVMQMSDSEVEARFSGYYEQHGNLLDNLPEKELHFDSDHDSVKSFESRSSEKSYSSERSREGQMRPKSMKKLSPVKEAEGENLVKKSSGVVDSEPVVKKLVIAKPLGMPFSIKAVHGEKSEAESVPVSPTKDESSACAEGCDEPVKEGVDEACAEPEGCGVSGHCEPPSTDSVLQLEEVSIEDLNAESEEVVEIHEDSTPVKVSSRAEVKSPPKLRMVGDDEPPILVPMGLPKIKVSPRKMPVKLKQTHFRSRRKSSTSSKSSDGATGERQLSPELEIDKQTSSVPSPAGPPIKFTKLKARDKTESRRKSSEKSAKGDRSSSEDKETVALPSPVRDDSPPLLERPSQEPSMPEDTSDTVEQREYPHSDSEAAGTLDPLQSEPAAAHKGGRRRSSDEKKAPRKRKVIQQSDHYRFRSKRVAVDYSPAAFTHIYQMEKEKSMYTSANPDAVSPPQRSKESPLKHTVKSQLAEGQTAHMRLFQGSRSMKVMVEKLDVEEDDVIIASRFLKRKRKFSVGSESLDSDSGGDSESSSHKKLASDIPSENLHDPLWQAQRERLADLPASSKTPSNGVSASSTDESSQDSTDASKRLSPKKKQLSQSKRLETAFLKSGKRRKPKVDSAKFINSLSALHMATVSSLDTRSEGPEKYSDNAGPDHEAPYDDVMYRMSLLSPVLSSEGEKSPARALSPCEMNGQNAGSQPTDEDSVIDLSTSLQTVPDTASYGSTLPEQELADIDEESQMPSVSNRDLTSPTLVQDDGLPPPDLGPPVLGSNPIRERVGKSESPPHLRTAEEEEECPQLALDQSSETADDVEIAEQVVVMETQDEPEDLSRPSEIPSLENTEMRATTPEKDNKAAEDVCPDLGTPLKDENEVRMTPEEEEDIDRKRDPGTPLRDEPSSEIIEIQEIGNKDSSVVDASNRMDAEVLDDSTEVVASSVVEEPQEQQESAGDTPMDDDAIKEVPDSGKPAQGKTNEDEEMKESKLSDKQEASQVEDKMDTKASEMETQESPVAEDEDESGRADVESIQSMSPIHSPSPPQSPEMQPECEPLHTPATIPLNIEDPDIQAEVEQARRAKLAKLVGRRSAEGAPGRDPKFMVLSQRKSSEGRRIRLPVEGSRQDRGEASQELCTCRDIADASAAELPHKDSCALMAGRTGGEKAHSPGDKSGRDRHGSSGSGGRGHHHHHHHHHHRRHDDDRHRYDDRDSPDSPDGSSEPMEISTGSTTRVLKKPLLDPPARSKVAEEVARQGLPTEPHQEAFCSNPADIPDKPRELGGRLLKIQSSLVSDLPDYESPLQSEGLKNWQVLLASRLLTSSQPNSSFDFVGEMERNPKMKAAMIGEDRVLITPCRVPPSCQKVRGWLKGRESYKKAKKAEQEKKLEEVSKPESRGTVRTHREKEDKAGRGKKTSGMPVKQSKSKPTEETTSTTDVAGHPQGPQTPTMSPPTKRRKSVDFSPVVQVVTPLRKSTSHPVASPSASPSNVMSSTPTKGSGHTLMPPPCTPISSKRPRVLTPTPGPSQRVARVCPNQKDTSQSEDSLRRVLLSSQAKNQYGTPAGQRPANVSQIDGPTPKNAFGFRMDSQNLQSAKAMHEFQYLTLLSIELHARCRKEQLPDPEFDPICALFYSIHNDMPPEKGQREVTGVIVIDIQSASQVWAEQRRRDDDGASTSKAADPSRRAHQKQLLVQRTGLPSVDVTYVKDEADLLTELVNIVKKWDPDILVGYEIQMKSWGYLLHRAAHLSLDLSARLARVPESKDTRFSAEKDEYGADTMSEIHIAGRIVLNLWRLVKHEVTLNIYSFENVVFHVLHRRIPLYTNHTLAQWFDHKTDLYRWRTIEHYIMRCHGNLKIIEQLDLIGQTSEFARVFGIEFYHVLSRGSQYRVESMMLRFAKPMNFIPVSPSIHQRARMRAPECIPLTMEPESKFYSDPVVVLDFRSLYPSIMIAYNYCYSTCLGRLEHLANAQDGPFEFGCTSLTIPPDVLKRLERDVNVCPNGVVFLRQHIKKGILARMVGDILNTRIMVKQSMKDYKDDKTMKRLLHARQLGLKLIANVTFGYTSANFSGRMPCMEIGDSIVRKARETLERAIKLVQDTPRWGGRVVYGDTDSLFIEFKGKSKDEAFRVGHEIADAVTADNPQPVKLKFEKVYLPCVLQTKKRYVGFMYETPDQKEPVYDAKGIETVRRDSCAAVAKVLEKSIKLMFTTRDVSKVKQYVQRQCVKLMEGKVSIQDCVFAKEFRGISGYRPGACVPALEIARKQLAKDKRSEPRNGERVPYVIVYGTPGLPLIQLVRQPGELLHDPNLRINATYYITKQIVPPLHRMFSLMGLDVMSWYNELPRVQRALPASHFTENRKGTISQYFSTLTCPVCEATTNHGTCDSCKNDPQRVAVVLNSRIHDWERTFSRLGEVCTNCMGTKDLELPCVSLDCPIMFRLNTAQRDVAQVPHILKIQKKMLQF